MRKEIIEALLKRAEELRAKQEKLDKGGEWSERIAHTARMIGFHEAFGIVLDHKE